MILSARGPSIGSKRKQLNRKAGVKCRVHLDKGNKEEVTPPKPGNSQEWG